MNRKERRAAAKLARDASNEENLVPGTYKPITEQVADQMRDIINVFEKAFPGHQIALIFGTPPTEKDPMGRANFASNCDRRDMIAIMKAYIARAEDPSSSLAKTENFYNQEPPTDAKN